MQNKIRVELELLSFKVDPSASKNDYYFLQIFDFGGRYRETGRWQGGLCCGFFLIGVLTIK